MTAYSDTHPVVLALLQNIEAGKSLLINPAQAEDLHALHPDIPWVVLSLLLTQLTWDMEPHLDEQGYQTELSFTWSELRRVCSPEQIATLKQWEQERKKLLSHDRLCERCLQPMRGDVPKDEVSRLAGGTLFALTPKGFKIYATCEWCLEKYKESADFPLWITMPKGPAQ